MREIVYFILLLYTYTLSEAWSGVNWADRMAAQLTPLQKPRTEYSKYRDRAKNRF